MSQVPSRPVDFFARRLVASLLAVASAASLTACKPESEASAATQSSAPAPGGEGEPVAEVAAAASTPAPSAGSYLLALESQNAGPALTPTGGNLRGVVKKASQNKYIESTTYEAIALQVPVALDTHLLGWITDTLSDSSSDARNGAVDSYDFNSHRIESLEFTDATISEVRFPAMISSGHATDTIGVKLAPDATRRHAASGTAPGGTPVAAWLQNNYLVQIDGLDATRVQRIEAFSLKFSDGPHGTTRADVGNLILTLPRNYAASWIDWADDFLAHPGQGDAGEREGKLVYLDAGLHAMLTLNLHHIGIVRVSDATNDPTRVVVELYVEGLDITRP